jgi:hypothetical protein
MSTQRDHDIALAEAVRNYLRTGNRPSAAMQCIIDGFTAFADGAPQVLADSARLCVRDLYTLKRAFYHAEIEELDANTRGRAMNSNARDRELARNLIDNIRFRRTGARNAAKTARKLARKCVADPTSSVCEAVQDLADTIETLADIIEEQNQDLAALTDRDTRRGRPPNSNARDRERARNAAQAARALAKECVDSASGICKAIHELADAVDLLADVSERQGAAHLPPT